MADFQTSTHRAKWIFSPQELLEKYKFANERAINALQQYGVTRLEVDIDGTVSYPEPILDLNNDQCPSLPKPLSCEEEHLMRIYYERKIQEVCEAFRFPHKIQGTAILYFKRFYLQWSVMEHHPKHIMLTCIYSSCKVEENHVSAEELGKGIQQDHQVILNNEMIVLQSLDFDLIVYTPYRSIDGYVDDIEDFFRLGRSQLQKIQELREAAKHDVDEMMLTDAPLLYPPGQIALAALWRSNEVRQVVDFERYLDALLSRQSSSHSISELIETFGAINLMVSGLKVPSMRELRHADRKLSACWDTSPPNDDTKKREKKSKHKSRKSSSEAHERPPIM